MGELNWIFTAITDTIAWNVLPRGEAAAPPGRGGPQARSRIHCRGQRGSEMGQGFSPVRRAMGGRKAEGKEPQERSVRVSWAP